MEKKSFTYSKLTKKGHLNCNQRLLHFLEASVPPTPINFFLGSLLILIKRPLSQFLYSQNSY